MSDLRTLLSEGLSPDQTLSSLYDIENILLLIGEIDHKIEYYRELKKHRTQSIDAKIEELTAKTDALRSIILNTMKKVSPNDKTLHFPDIGKVTRRQGKDSFAITDEPQLLSYLEKQGKKSEVVKVIESVDKRKLNSVVDALQKRGEHVPGLSVVPGSESLSIAFEKSDDVAPPQSSGHAKVNLDELDALLV